MIWVNDVSSDARLAGALSHRDESSTVSGSAFQWLIDQFIFPSHVHMYSCVHVFTCMSKQDFDVTVYRVVPLLAVSFWIGKQKHYRSCTAKHSQITSFPNILSALEIMFAFTHTAQPNLLWLRIMLTNILAPNHKMHWLLNQKLYFIVMTSFP